MKVNTVHHSSHEKVDLSGIFRRTEFQPGVQEEIIKPRESVCMRFYRVLVHELSGIFQECSWPRAKSFFFKKKKRGKKEKEVHTK